MPLPRLMLDRSSVGGTGQKPTAAQSSHTRSSSVPPCVTHCRCSRKNASESRSSRSLTATPWLHRSSRDSRNVLPLWLVDDRRDDAAAARAGRRPLELLWFNAKKGVGPRAHLSPAHRARERETGIAQRIAGRRSEEVGQRGEPVPTYFAAATGRAESVRSVLEE